MSYINAEMYDALIAADRRKTRRRLPQGPSPQASTLQPRKTLLGSRPRSPIFVLNCTGRL